MKLKTELKVGVQVMKHEIDLEEIYQANGLFVTSFSQKTAELLIDEESLREFLENLRELY